jgi:cytochrome oxidase Cu insertion factor (SCO1/SenC/PrrC family)
MKHTKFYISMFVFAVIALVSLYGRYGVPAARTGMEMAHITPAAGEEAKPYDIGGPFSLVNQDGETVTDQDLKGSYKLLFFGFSNCPDECPAGLKKITRTMELLGDKEAQLQPVLITVDPARDTPEVLKEYVALFHPRMMGLTGDEAQIKSVLDSYKVFASKAEAADHEAGSEDHHDGHHDDYVMNHSSFIYLLDPENRVLDFFSAEDSAEDMASSISPRISGS